MYCSCDTCRYPAGPAYGYKLVKLTLLSPATKSVVLGAGSGSGDYLLTAYGDIIDLGTRRLLEQQTDARGFKSVTIGGQQLALHTLMADSFLPPPSSQPTSGVQHKNGMHGDNRADNLQWSNMTV